MVAKKKKLILALVLIVITVIAFSFWLKNQGTQPDQIKNKEEVGGESQVPLAKIVSPTGGTSYNKNFSVKVWDVDSGGSGIDANQCFYSVYNCSADGCKLSVANRKRTCNGDFSVKVGQAGDCFLQGANACRVIVKSKDEAGNDNILSESEESIRDFGVDWTQPQTEIIALPSDASKTVLARVSDNVEISNCDLVVDGQSQYGLGKQFAFSQISCSQEIEGKCYEAALELALAPAKDHELRIGCWDGAGNIGYSQTAEIKAPVNRQPEISSCRVSPVQGNLQKEFQFGAEASDLDGDDLSYLWNFGDGFTATEKNPVHRYDKEGIFEPQVTVSDGGKEAKCSTAWVSIAEE